MSALRQLRSNVMEYSVDKYAVSLLQKTTHSIYESEQAFAVTRGQERAFSAVRGP
jgi:hypothetical protein